MIKSLRTMAIGLAAAAAVLAGTPASALSFVFTTVSGQAPTIDEQNAFQAAANVWSSYISSNVTVNIALGATAMNNSTLASTNQNYYAISGSTLRSALTSHENSADDVTAVNSLSNIGNSTYAITSANLHTLGVSGGSSIDATITINSNVVINGTSYGYSTSRNADGTIAANTFDLVGIYEHEIGHALGFDSYIDTYDYNVAHSSNPSGVSDYQTVLDLFRYTTNSNGQVVRTEANGPAYFSIDGGQTRIASFADGVSDQASHWAQGTNGVMAPEASAGQVENITALDLRAMDVLGYNLANVPEPTTWSMMILGFGAIGGVLRLRRREVGLAF